MTRVVVSTRICVIRLVSNVRSNRNANWNCVTFVILFVIFPPSIFLKWRNHRKKLTTFWNSKNSKIILYYILLHNTNTLLDYVSAYILTYISYITKLQKSIWRLHSWKDTRDVFLLRQTVTYCYHNVHYKVCQRREWWKRWEEKAFDRNARK